MSVFQAAMPTGNYPNMGAGYLARRAFVGELGVNQWVKWATVSAPIAVRASILFLVNGGQDPNNEGSGLLELNFVRQVEDVSLVVCSGYIKSENFAYVINGTSIDLYVYCPSYRDYQIAVLDELIGTATNKNTYVTFSNVGTGSSTAPEGAVYAVVRNNASFAESAGHLQHQGISSISSSTIGWYKVGTTSASKIVAGNGSVSVIFLVNGVHQIENTTTPTRSGLLELDVAKFNGNFTAFTISVLGGALDPEQFFGVLENNVVTLYWRNVSRYGKVDFTILTQQDETLSNWVDLFEFDTAFYGTTAPEGAVYAVVRNIASYAESIPVASESVFGGAKMWVKGGKLYIKTE